jgi:hypothetical protein
MSKLIPIQGGNSEGLFTIIDDNDCDKVSKYKWWLDDKGYPYTVISKHGRNQKNVRLHRFILNFPQWKTDHKNRNKLDNRKQNLREATHTQNMHNVGKKNITSKSKYIGVSFREDRNKWRAYIWINSKYVTLGHYATEEEAVIARDKAVKSIRGEFGVLNLDKELDIENYSIPKKKTSSNYKGVCFDNKLKKWRARVNIDGKRKHIGFFKTEIEAIEAIKNYND